MGEHVGKLKNI